MTLFDAFAAATMASGLIAAGVMIGWRLCERFNRPAPTPEPAVAARVVVTVLGRTVQTDLMLDKAQLEVLANGIGRYTAPLPSTTTH